MAPSGSACERGSAAPDPAGGEPVAAAPPDGSSESLLTVLVAGGVNLLIAAAKLFVGILGGSSSMVSESAHSFADTVTEGLLFVAVRRGTKPPDRRRPFGYGRESYFWALLAAMCTFGVGGVFSIYHGTLTILSGEPSGHYPLAYGVLAASAVLEGISLTRSLRQARGVSRRLRITLGEYVRTTPDTAVRAVTLEDVAAEIGIALAAIGLALEQLTGSGVYDGIASVLIGLLLCAVGYRLISVNKSLLIGQSVPDRTLAALRAELSALPGVEDVVELFATYLGPEQILVAAKIDFVDDVPADEVERLADEGARRLRARIPRVTHVYLDPTNRAGPKPN